MLKDRAMFCEHANEVPARCPCSQNCYCKEHTCKDGNMKRKRGPLFPSEVTNAKRKQIPDRVFDIVNELILDNWNGKRARVMQHEIVARITDDPSLVTQDIHDKGWLNFEDVYRQVGWKVKYEKPGWDESFNSYFVFEKE